MPPASTKRVDCLLNETLSASGDALVASGGSEGRAQQKRAPSGGLDRADVLWAHRHPAPPGGFEHERAVVERLGG